MALYEKQVLFTATDGLLRAVDLATGADRWQYDAGAPQFAGAVVEKGIAYVANLAGCVHAVKADTGEKVWKLNLAAEAKVGRWRGDLRHAVHCRRQIVRGHV